VATGGSAAGLPEHAAQVSRGTVVVEVATRNGTRSGSGFFLEEPGLLATALHTVEGARRVRVAIPGRFAASDARLLAVSSAWDLAVLEVEWPADVPYPGLRLDTAPLVPGEEVALTGYGHLGDHLSAVPLTIRGIVSGNVEHQGSFAHVLDLGAREGFSGSPVFRTGGGAVAGVLTRVHAPPGGSGPGGASPASALAALLSAVRPWR
jgi:hypothetical protein